MSVDVCICNICNSAECYNRIYKYTHTHTGKYIVELLRHLVVVVKGTSVR